MSEMQPTAQRHDPGAHDGAEGRDLTIDQLEYVTDLIAELREMCQRARLETLAALLALAQAEAAREGASQKRAVGGAAHPPATSLTRVAG